MRSKAARTTFTEQGRRDQIIAAAVDVLADDGYSATSLAAIAARVGVSKGVISYYFAGKDELLSAVVSRVLTEAAQYMQPRIREAGSNLEALRNYLITNLDYIDAHRREIRALTEIFNATRPGVTHPYAEGHHDAVQALTELLRRGQRAGEFGEFSAVHVAIAIRAAIDAVSELLRADSKADLHSYGGELAALFERGVRV